MISPDTDKLLRELIASQATTSANIAALDKRVGEVASDARQARDAAIESAAATKALDVPAKLVELRAEMHAGDGDLRSDLVNATTRLKTDLGGRLDSHDARLKALEGAREKDKGARSIWNWIAKHMPWLIALGVALASYFDWGKHH